MGYGLIKKAVVGRLGSPLTIQQRAGKVKINSAEWSDGDREGRRE
jgi:hypothetical protein